MRKYILSLTVILLNLLSPYAQTVNVADVTLNPSETKVISINLENTQTNIVSFQMDITLPEGITLNKEGCKLSRRFTDEDQELTIGKQPNGDYRLTSTSFSLKPISGTSGEIIKLSLSASETAAGGTASISNIRLATNNSDKFTPSNTLFKVNVPYTLTYKVDGVEYKTSSIPCGTVLISEEDPIKEGHTFSGWDEIPETMPPHDVTVTGTFTINQYTVTFKVDGEVFKTYTQDYGTAITTPESPTREGYTFSGWQDVASTVPAQDLTYEANFTVNQYTLKFVADGQVVNEESVDYGSTITPPTAPAKTGYHFVTWGDVAASMPANDVTYTAQYSINQYIVTFKVDDEVYKTFTQDYGTEITIPEPPTKEGYTFSGWKNVASIVPAQDVTYEATFTVNQYTITFKVDGEVFKTFMQDYGTDITIPESPIKEGYTFSGWNNVAATVPANDVTYEANFTINQYTMKFVADGQVVIEKSVDYGSTITAPEAPAKTGYTFVTWGDVAATMPAKDVTYTAQYTINLYTVTFKVDGEVIKSETLDYGAPIVEPEVEQKEGRTFSGWNTKVAETMPAQNVEYTGSYLVNPYKITYFVDDEEYFSANISYGAVVTAIDWPVKEGYTFGGWSEIPTTMPAHDVIARGTFSINQYIVTFKVDGEVYKTLTQDYGTAITTPKSPTREGYTFSGWQDVASTVPAQDVTYEAIFTINQYTLKFVADGNVVGEESVNYGSSINAPEAPAKTGYTFVSWGDVAATMPANDVTYTAQYSINQYTITFKVDGEVYQTLTQDYGTAITIPEAPTKEGYTFSGWQNVASTVPAQDVTCEANFTVNQYTLKFVADGTVVSEISVDYGSTITAPQAPAKTGHTFVSWGDVAATMPAKDVTYTAQYNVNQYKLIYLFDGNVYKTCTLDYDSVITPEGDPEDDDYFYAWEDIPERMPDHDVTVNAYITGIADAGKGLALGEYEIYSLDGKKLNDLQIGVNIIRYPNGTTQKIFIR